MFVTGTDTGVGKTVVAAALAALARRRGVDVGVIKPIATGCRAVGGRLVSDDALFLAGAAGTDDPEDLVCPVRLCLPLAPTVAAALERRRIGVRAIRSALRETARRHDCLIVEGIGGMMVPVVPGYLVADLAAELGAPLVIVARATLGTVNHTLLTVACAHAWRLDVAAVVLNSPVAGRSGLAERTNPQVLRKLCAPVPVIGPLRYCREASVENGRLGRLPSMLGKLDGVDKLLAEWLGA